jgi:hypothetical protein
VAALLNTSPLAQARLPPTKVQMFDAQIAFLLHAAPASSLGMHVPEQ